MVPHKIVRFLVLIMGVSGAPLLASRLPGFSFDKVAETEGFPTSLAIDSEGQLFYSVTTGQVYQIGSIGSSTEVALVPTASEGNAALLGVAFRGDDELIAHYVSPDLTADVLTSVRLRDGVQTEIARWLCDLGRPCSTEHHGGNPVVAPDGTIYVGIGDFGGGAIAQSTESPGGKIFRISPSGVSRMFALGFRNPFDFAIGEGGGYLIVGDNGPEGGDEIHLVREGDNCGWPYTVGNQAPLAGTVPPSYSFSETVAPTGVFRTVAQMPFRDGGVLVGSFVTKALYFFPDIEARPLPAPVTILEKETGPIIDVVQNRKGDIFFATPGVIYQLRLPRPGDANGDGRVEPADFEAIAREIHDGDGNLTIRASEGSFPGSWGADVNVDGIIDSRDLVALTRILRTRTRPIR